MSDKPKPYALPTSVKVGPYTIAVTFHEELRDEDDNRLWGQCRMIDQEIRMDQTAGAERMHETFIHELLHAIDHVYDVGLGEKKTRRLALGLATYLRAHPGGGGLLP